MFAALLAFVATGWSTAVWATDLAVESVPVTTADEDADSQLPLETLQQRLQTDITYLASDELAGRDVGSPGLQLAAEYIAQSFADAGLDTALFDGTPWQTFPIPIAATITGDEHNRLQIATPSGETLMEGRLEQNFVPLAIGDNAAANGRLVFVGYGISAPELGYDDYADVDVQGAVVMVIRKEPQGSEADKLFDGDRNSPYAFFEAKVKAAAAHGAAAVLLVNDPESVAGMIAAIQRRREAEQQTLDKLQTQLDGLPAGADNARSELENQRQLLRTLLDDFDRQKQLAAEGLLGVQEAGRNVVAESLPVICIGQSIANQLLLDHFGKTLVDLKRQIDQQVRPASGELAVTAELETQLSPASVASSNVLGVLPGRGDLADQTVVVGAHYDHVGMGGIGSLAPGTIAVHNGADDNASGTSVLLSSVHEVRQRLQDSDHHRRVLFIAFTGEERGLLGSEHYVTHPRFPLSDTVAMVNLDMVGRLRNNDLTVYGVGTAPEFSDLLDRVNEHTEFQLFKVASGYGPSDHQSFFTRKVPILFFFTGLHNDYHRPSDKIDKINLTGMARITDITSRVVVELATAAQRPGYQDTDRSVQIRQQEASRAYLGVSLRDVSAEQLAEQRQNIPAADPPQPIGAMVSAVATDSAAADAGIQTGDRLLRVGGVPVASLGDVIGTVQEREVGDRLEIELERDGQMITVSVTLKLRPVARR